MSTESDLTRVTHILCAPTSNDTTEGLCFPKLIHQMCLFNRATAHTWFWLAFIFSRGQGLVRTRPSSDICPDPSPGHRFVYTRFSVRVQLWPSRVLLLCFLCCVLHSVSQTTPPTSPRCWWKDFRGLNHLGQGLHNEMMNSLWDAETFWVQGRLKKEGKRGE